MNPSYFGDSYDLVKRFICAELSALGYVVFIDPMFTGEWLGAEAQFFKLVGAAPLSQLAGSEARAAILVDPDTGVHSKAGERHVSLAQLVELSMRYALVVAFDQSFSRQATYPAAMQTKLSRIEQLGAKGMYYDSHARFLFVARGSGTLEILRTHLLNVGLPSSRLLTTNVI